MAIIFGLAGRKLARPVNRKAKSLQLRLHVCDIVAGPASGVDILFHRRIFSGHAKGVPTHGMQHLMPRHPFVARQHITHGVVADMANMDAARRIGKHLKHISARLGRIIIRDEAAAFFPNILPPRVGNVRVKALFVGHRNYPVMDDRRRSRALVRMTASSFCTVAARNGAATHWPFCETSRLPATRKASARRS